MAFFKKSVFTFGYSVPDGAELLLNFSDQADHVFEIAGDTLKGLSSMTLSPLLHEFPFDLPINDPIFEKIAAFKMDEWYLAAGLLDADEDWLFRVFLINKENHDLALVYDLDHKNVAVVATDGFDLIDEEGIVREGEEIYDILGLNETSAPLPPAPTIAQASQEAPTKMGPRIYNYSWSTIGNSQCRIYTPDFIFEEIERELKDISGFEISPKAVLFPRFVLESKELMDAITFFDFRDWFPLAANLTPNGYVFNILLVRKDNPGVALIVSLIKKMVYAITTTGYTLDQDGVTLGALAIQEKSGCFQEGRYIGPSQKEESENPRQTPSISVEEAPKKEEIPRVQEVQTPSNNPKVTPAPQVSVSPEEEEKREEAFVEKEETTLSLTPVRRVYRSRRYDRCVDNLKKKHPELSDKLAKIYQALLTSSDEDLNQYLALKKSKGINGLDWCSIAKFRVANSGPFKADRIFYLRGDDCKNGFGRGIPSNAIVLLYLSDTSEHDEQGEIAHDLEAKIRQEESEVLKDLDVNGPEVALNSEVYEVAFQRSSQKDKPSYSQYGVLSVNQSDLLHKDKAPCAFSGSAGTGKTLMSIDLYRSFRKEHPDYRILYLTYQDALKGRVERSFAELGVNAECLTFKDLVFQELGPNLPFKEQADFLRWVLSKYLMIPGGKSTLGKITPDLGEAADIAYVFYRGIIEGSSLNQTRQKADLLSREEFLDEASDEKGFTLEQKNRIYDIAIAYRDHVNRHQEVTDNLAAEKLLVHPHPFYDAIIVDETQDLTELQVLSICSLLKEGSKQLYLFGDDNQAINPTIFTIEDAAACIKMALGPGIEVPVQVLHGAYRSSSFLVRYINDINQVKRKAIGAYGNENDADETTLRVDEKGSLPRLIKTPELAEALLRNPATFKGDTVVIVPNSELKNSLKEKHPEINPVDIVTIAEAKGQEWDNAIVYDFLSSASELWDAMLSEKRAGKKSTLHRMLFNRYYVALTRAKDRLIIVEDNVTPRIFDALLKVLTPIRKESEIPQYLTDTLTSADWLSYAYTSFNDRDFNNAKRCLSKIPLAEQDTNIKTLKDDIDLYQLASTMGLDFSKEKLADISEFIDCFLRHNDIEYLRKLYVNRQANGKIRLLSLDDKSDLDVLNEAANYLVSQPQNFTAMEKRFFENRLFHFFDLAIKNSLTTIENTLGGQNNATR